MMTGGALAQSHLDCGKIQSGSLSIPALKFIVVDKNGQQFANLHAVGGVQVRTWVWRHSYGDWNWEDESRFLSFPVTYDRKEGVYRSKAIPSLEIKDIGNREYQCLDRLVRFYVGFTLGNEFNETTGYAGAYGLNLWDKTFDEIVFPDPQVPIKVTLKSWGGSKEL